MTARFYVKCSSCGKVTLIRVQMGYLEYHPIRVNCGFCKATISGEFKNGSVDFGRCVLEQNTQADFVIQSSGELLTHKLKAVTSETDTTLPSPFINNMMLIKREEFATFGERLTYVLKYRSDIFPTIRIINEHYYNNNTDLMVDQIHTILPKKQFPSSNRLELLRSVHMINNLFFMNISKESLTFSSEFFNLLKSLMDKSFFSLFGISKYFESKNVYTLWGKRIFQLNVLIADNIAKFMPVLWCDLYSQPFETIESEYAITTVVFEEIESIYLKCYELLSDMLPLIIAYNNLLVRNDFNKLKSPNPMNDKALTLDDYFKIQQKGTRIQYLDGSEPLEHVVCDAFNKGIRNAIGHFDYEYEMDNPFKQTYRFYNINNRSKFQTQSLLSLCYETWKMYISVLKLSEVLYQTQKISLAANGYTLDVKMDDLQNWV